MTLDGKEVSFANPAAANAAGIVCIFQELSLVPELSVADNICISNPPKRFGLIDRKAQRRIAVEALARAGGEDIHPLSPVKDLPLSRRQLVEIAKALVRQPRILILDEATSALTAADVRKVFAVLKRLRQEGLALLYISHRMAEIAELADECTVFRNGRNVGTFTSGTKNDTEIVEMMIGREYSHVFPPKPAPQPADKAPTLASLALLGLWIVAGPPSIRISPERPRSTPNSASRSSRWPCPSRPPRPTTSPGRMANEISLSRFVQERFLVSRIGGLSAGTGSGFFGKTWLYSRPIIISTTSSSVLVPAS